uniref:Uncharacterized protein n=1 Tax=Vespula pensylvanica TaxID=30213 RepID=A0A834PC07_VESPE|nr:hypothetical protein H0235_003473 [Vespula pensylvanica]
MGTRSLNSNVKYLCSQGRKQGICGIYGFTLIVLDMWAIVKPIENELNEPVKAILACRLSKVTRDIRSKDRDENHDRRSE